MGFGVLGGDEYPFKLVADDNIGDKYPFGVRFGEDDGEFLFNVPV